MAEQTIPVSQLAVNDRMWMGGSALWGRVTAVRNDGRDVEATVVYDTVTRPVTFVRTADFKVRVDREVPS